MMHYTRHHDLNLSQVGIGCYALSGVYGKKDLNTYKRMLGRACELGVTFFDAAEAYGDAERVLGEAIRPYRANVHIATKVGVRESYQPNLSADYIVQACEQSLQRLQVEVIDLYQVHFDDPNTPVAETVGALESLVQAGKIRYYGVGHLPAERVQEYLQHGHLFSILIELSAVAREARGTTLPLCQQHGVGAIAFSVTGRGLLTGRFGADQTFAPDDIRHIDPLFQRERFRSGLRVANKLAEIGQRHDRSAVQVAIAWALAQPAVICALTGPSSVAHLEENVAAGEWRLPAAELATLETFLAHEGTQLAHEQRDSVRQILTGPLPADPGLAFKELVYAIETAILLDLVRETEVLPTFRQLFALHGRQLDAAATPTLIGVWQQLRELIPSAANDR